MIATDAYSRKHRGTQTRTHECTWLICSAADKACRGGVVAPVIAHTWTQEYVGYVNTGSWGNRRSAGLSNLSFHTLGNSQLLFMKHESENRLFIWAPVCLWGSRCGLEINLTRNNLCSCLTLAWQICTGNAASSAFIKCELSFKKKTDYSRIFQMLLKWKSVVFLEILVTFIPAVNPTISLEPYISSAPHCFWGDPIMNITNHLFLNRRGHEISSTLGPMRAPIWVTGAQICAQSP